MDLLLMLSHLRAQIGRVLITFVVFFVLHKFRFGIRRQVNGMVEQRRVPSLPAGTKA